MPQELLLILRQFLFTQSFLFGFEEAVNLLDKSQQLFGVLFCRRLFTQLLPLLAVFQADTFTKG